MDKKEFNSVSGKVERRITKAKKELVTKAKKHGLWENFGQDKVRDIEDEFSDYSLNYGDSYERKLGNMIKNFYRWCINFNDRDLRNT